ncbi:hypothetical protein cypCar_00040687, partial [Cyprinus carpio]
WKDVKPDELMDSKLRCVFELPSENDKASDVESKPAPVLNSSKADGPVSVNDSEMKKILEECKRLQTERPWLRLRRFQRSEHVTSNSSSALGQESRAGSLPSLLVVIAAIFIGFFLGKFIL